MQRNPSVVGDRARGLGAGHATQVLPPAVSRPNEGYFAPERRPRCQVLLLSPIGVWRTGKEEQLRFRLQDGGPPSSKATG
ncbi:hypothetical protein VTJ04DRAFT_1971 [Mycothermus thermophilus]|uniref:uncharacterized protein n=1 Tax=Humicola insolens TaxID=85995 RepID=UPI003742888C